MQSALNAIEVLSYWVLWSRPPFERDAHPSITPQCSSHGATAAHKFTSRLIESAAGLPFALLLHLVLEVFDNTISDEDQVRHVFVKTFDSGIQVVDLAQQLLLVRRCCVVAWILLTLGKDREIN
jgi:hypothetical protein